MSVEITSGCVRDFTAWKEKPIYHKYDNVLLAEQYRQSGAVILYSGCTRKILTHIEYINLMARSRRNSYEPFEHIQYEPHEEIRKQLIMGYIPKGYSRVNFINHAGELHNDDGPAIITTRSARWIKNGIITRNDAPAIILFHEYEVYVKNGYMYREDGPAYINRKYLLRIYTNQTGEWHATARPAYKTLHSDRWYKNNILHRDNGLPAVWSRYSTYDKYDWYQNGVFVRSETDDNIAYRKNMNPEKAASLMNKYEKEYYPRNKRKHEEIAPATLPNGAMREIEPGEIVEPPKQVARVEQSTAKRVEPSTAKRVEPSTAKRVEPYKDVMQQTTPPAVSSSVEERFIQLMNGLNPNYSAEMIAAIIRHNRTQPPITYWV